MTDPQSPSSPASARKWLWIALIAGLAIVAAAWFTTRSQSIYGIWRVELAHPGGALPFGLELVEEDGKPVAYLLNPPERLRAETTMLDGNQLSLAFPSYGSKIRLTLERNDTLTGAAVLVRRTGPVTLAASGKRAIWRFFEKPEPAAANLTGRWQVGLDGDTPEQGLAQLTQTGNKLSGSIQFPTGDTRYLAGEISGTRLALSTFDGNSTSLWEGEVSGTSIKGARFGATSTSPTAWTGRKLEAATVEAVNIEKPPVDRIAFKFPTADGQPVSLADARFKGKVVVVAIGGTWCPNCQDEARFLGPYAAANKAAGLEVIGLNFEYKADPASIRSRLKGFADRHQLPYPMLLAGEPTPESTKVALPGIGGVKVYPSALFIGRDGRLREIHVGWAGPATGELNVKAQREFDATVKRLLAEKA